MSGEYPVNVRRIPGVKLVNDFWGCFCGQYVVNFARASQRMSGENLVNAWRNGGENPVKKLALGEERKFLSLERTPLLKVYPLLFSYKSVVDKKGTV
jgi:hypothetical protein